MPELPVTYSYTEKPELVGYLLGVAMAAAMGLMLAITGTNWFDYLFSGIFFAVSMLPVPDILKTRKSLIIDKRRIILRDGKKITREIKDFENPRLSRAHFLGPDTDTGDLDPNLATVTYKTAKGRRHTFQIDFPGTEPSELVELLKHAAN